MFLFPVFEQIYILHCSYSKNVYNIILFSPPYRYTVKELLQHDFFVEESGFKVELVNTEDEELKPNIIFLRVRVVDPKKRKIQHKENEAIQFGYNLEKDDPEYVAKEMVRNDSRSTAPKYCIGK
jgi:WNK lysine deficient protein kinase